MRDYKLILPVSLLLVLTMVFPSFSLSEAWEECTSLKSCAERFIPGKNAQMCHNDPADGVWKWQDSLIVIAKVESGKNFAGICSDGVNNNCDADGFLDSDGNGDPAKIETNDCVPPSISIISVAGGTGAPYYDVNGGDSKTDIVVSAVPAELGMACRLDAISHDYSDTQGTLCITSGSSATCTVNDAATEGAKTRYVACKDFNENGQSSSQSKTVNWINDWTGPAITFNSPPNPAGVPYNIGIVLSDVYAGVDKPSLKIFVSNNGGPNIDITSSFSGSGTCESAGVTCTYTRTVINGDAEAADGAHKLTVTVKDNIGNTQQSPNTYTYAVSTCKLDSATIAPSASCNKNINMCTSAGTACNGGNAIDVTAKYTGLSCPATFTVRVDAKTSDNLCNVQGSGGQMNGISITCSNPAPSASQQTCTGTWILPTPIPSPCQKKTIAAKSGPNDACINGDWCTTPSGAFGACLDTVPPIVSIILNSGNDYTASRTVTATSLSGKDNTYGLISCLLDWGEGTEANCNINGRTCPKACIGTVGEECTNQFSSADKQHAYSSDGLKTSTFSCVNKNGITGSSSDPLAICTSMGGITNLKAWGSSSKTNPLSGSAWQNDNTPYFEWSAVASLCGVKYDVQTDSNPAVTTTINSYTPGALSDGTHTIKVTSKDGNNLGLAGASQTFILWVDTVAPSTSMVETIPAWFTIAPTLHLSCTDANSGCSSTKYCFGAGCSPATTYTTSGVPVSSTTVLGYSSADAASNPEITKYKTIYVDTTPPSTPSVTDDGAFTALSDRLTASWTTVTDPQSGIAEYQYAVGTTAGGTDVLGFTGAGLSNSATITGLSLLEGTTYYVSVRAKNNAGLFGSAGMSDGITADMSGPAGINALSIERAYGSFISGAYSIFTGPLTDLAGINTASCFYTIDGVVWATAVWNSTGNSCKIAGLSCSDGDVVNAKMRVSDLFGTKSETPVPLTKTCDTLPPELQSFVPATGMTITTASNDLSFSVTAKDVKSGLAKIEWSLYLNGNPAGTVIKNCDAGSGVSATCNFQSSEFVPPATLKTGDKLFVRVRADDHIDPWSPTGDSGEWSINENAPTVSSVTPVLATLGVQQDYSANVEAVSGKTITSCDLMVNGAKVDGMALTSGTTANGIWTGKYTISAPAAIFMRAKCVDNEGLESNGMDVPIELATGTASSIKPSTVEKLQIANITARYTISGGGFITNGRCWVSSSNFNDPAAGIVGVNLQDINDGYYTYSFAAPAISGPYNYVVSCAKAGYQTTSGANSFSVLGCDGAICIKVAPENTIAILKLGETQNINLNLKNRADVENTYSVSLVSPNPNVVVGIAPVQVTLKNGEEKKVNVQLTSLVINDQQITSNILVKNTDPLKKNDFATVTINSSIAVGSVPDIGALEILVIFAAASFMVYRKIKI